MNESKKQLCAQLWECYESNLRRLCNIKLVGPEEDKEEIISEVFLIMCKKIELEGEIEYPQAWLYGTLDNLLKQKYTENNKVNITYLSEYEEIELPYDYDTLDEVCELEDLEDLKEVLKNELSEEEKQLLYYILSEDKSYREIAELMASNENSIKQRKYRLFRKIKKLVKRKK